MRGASLAALCLAGVVLAGCSAGPGGHRGFRGRLPATANPGRIVALELSMARMIREDGQSAAFQHYAADDAVMFVPGPVTVQDWLKQHELPSSPVDSDPVQVWSSCDGSLAVAKGVWQRENGSAGWSVTVWERQDDGEYRFVLADGGNLDTPMDAPDMVQAKVAECRNVPDAAVADGPARGGAYRWQRISDDRTLDAELILGRDGAGRLTTSMARDGEFPVVLDQPLSRPGGPG